MVILLLFLWNKVGVVDQDIFLFGGIIWENLIIVYFFVIFEDIVDVGRLVGVDEFI